MKKDISSIKELIEQIRYEAGALYERQEFHDKKTERFNKSKPLTHNGWGF